MLHQLVSLVGAALILGAYGSLQMKRLSPDSTAFALLNFFGSTLLTWSAIVDMNYGFIILEASWAILSLLPLVRRRASAGG